MRKSSKSKRTDKSQSLLLLVVVCYMFFAATYLIEQYSPAATDLAAAEQEAVNGQELMSAAVAVPELLLSAGVDERIAQDQTTGLTGGSAISGQSVLQEQPGTSNRSETTGQPEAKEQSAEQDQTEIKRLTAAMSDLDVYMKSVVGYIFPTIKYNLQEEIDFADLQQQNNEVVGWLICEGTAIDYPVFKDDNNDYYLYHLLDGSYSVDGSLFIDCRNNDNFADNNTIIHGHHMRSGAMFASLVEYKDQDYYEEHPYMLLLTPEDNYVIELFSAHVVATDDPVYTFSFAADNEEYLDWLQDLKQRSDFDCAVVPTADDKIVTLSTCDYVFDNARYVVHGRLLRILNESDAWK